jgi:hypothetical protein
VNKLVCTSLDWETLYIYYAHTDKLRTLSFALIHKTKTLSSPGRQAVSEKVVELKIDLVALAS